MIRIVFNMGKASIDLIGRKRPNMLTVLVVSFFLLLSLSIFQAAKLTLHEQHFIDDLAVLRLKEETSQHSLSPLPADFWAVDYISERVSSAHKTHQLQVRV